MAIDPWRPLFDLGVHAYFAGEIEPGRRACEDLLSLDGVPAVVRQQARRNQVFYAPRLAELVPSLAARPVAFPVPDGWSRLNPSVAAAEGG